MGASGSIDYSVVSGSYYAYTTSQTGSTDSIPKGGNPRPRPMVGYLTGSTTTVIVTESLTVKYFQRVWDIDNSQWCYYTQTAINASPGTTDTQPNNSGNIISSSIVQILEIY